MVIRLITDKKIKSIFTESGKYILYLFSNRKSFESYFCQLPNFFPTWCSFVPSVKQLATSMVPTYLATFNVPKLIITALFHTIKRFLRKQHSAFACSKDESTQN